MIQRCFFRSLVPWLLSSLLLCAPLICLAQQTSLDATEQKVLYYSAIQAKTKGNADEAIKLFQTFLQRNAGVAAGWYELGLLKADEGLLQDAEKDIRKAISLDASNAVYQEVLGELLNRQGKTSDAAKVFADLANQATYKDNYLFRAAQLYQQSGKLQDAMEQLRKVVALRPYSEDVLMAQQQLFLQMNDVESAAGVVRKLIDISPREVRYYALLADVYASNKMPDKARAVAADIAKRFPDDPDAQLTLAIQSLKQGDTAAYRSYLRSAITNPRLDVDSKLGLLLTYARQQGGDSSGRAQVAQVASELARQYPKDAKVSAMYAEVLAWNNDTRGAAEQYKLAVAADPSKFANWQQLLFSYTAPADADSLIHYGEKSLRLFPNQAVAYFLTGVGYVNKKQFPKAIRYLHQGIELQPEDEEQLMASMLTTLGDAQNAAGNYAASDSAYNAALALDSRNATLLNNYAYYLSVRNTRLDDAARMSLQSLQIRPGEPTFLDTYGWILYQQGKYTEALKYMQQAVDSAGQDVDGTLYDHLGDVHFRLGKVDEAVRLWQQAQKLGVDNKDIDQKIRDRKIPK